MTAWLDIWSGVSLRQMESLTGAARDQVEACVQAVCRAPFEVGDEFASEGPRSRPVRMARAGSVLVLFQLDEIGELVYVLGVEDRG